MILNIININLYDYLSFTLIFCLLAYIYNILKANINKRLEKPKESGEVCEIINALGVWSRRKWDLQMRLCFAVELDEQLYANIIIMIIVAFVLL